MDNIILILILLFIITYSIYIVRYEKRSVKSKLVENAIKFSGYKKRARIEENIEEKITKRKEEGNKPYNLPLFPYKQSIEKYLYKEMEYFIINDAPENDNYIFYLHGGAYFSDPLIFHFQFLDELSKKTNSTIIMPLYPKSAFSNYKDSINLVYEFYNEVFSNIFSEKITIMGDSSGGGFALVIAQLLNENKKDCPKNVILLSPWLDLTLKNPEIENYEESDPQLSVESLLRMGDLWAGGSSKDDKLLSPINGSFKNIGKITIFIGTHEIFLPDARKFKEICKKQHVKINYYEYEKMNHVFILQPIPEAKKALKKIISVIKSKIPTK